MSDNPAQSNVTSHTIRTPKYDIIYSDTFSMRATGVDFTLTFGVQNDAPTPQGRVPVLIEQVAVSMTLTMAKSLAINLRKIIKATEEVIGPIPIVGSSMISDEFLQQIKLRLEENQIVIKSIEDFDKSPD